MKHIIVQTNGFTRTLCATAVTLACLGSTSALAQESDNVDASKGKLEKIEVATGETVTFDKVLMVKSGEELKIGAPYVEGGKVTAEVVSQGRHDKVKIVKFRRRKHSMKQAGHRQWFTEVKITGISG